MSQIQMQMQMQSKEQLQSQKYSNFTMATMLSTAEHIVWRSCKDDYESLEFLINEYSRLNGYIKNKLIFNSYNAYNSGMKKDLSSLICQFIFQLETFYDDYNEFVRKYKKYSFPNNMSKEKILEIINIWMTALSNSENGQKYKKYFINLKNIFEKNPIKSYENEIIEKYKNHPKTKKENVDYAYNEYMKALNIVETRNANIDNQNIEIWN
jgi:hypothetical protein